MVTGGGGGWGMATVGRTVGDGHRRTVGDGHGVRRTVEDGHGGGGWRGTVTGRRRRVRDGHGGEDSERRSQEEGGLWEMVTGGGGQ